ncbi:TetR/AcrR family transcriptional regulator [Chitinophaga sp.]|uniref:TetR/AcrR family transcriptional regulator n=1 Tax=Chitinophaga sp. TaxID=1869181 RepID=UPI0031DB4153
MRQRDENKILTITEKAIEIIADEGLENFGINKLARAAGVSPATIYIYYKDKEDLLTQLSVEVGKRISDAALNGLEPDMSFEAGLWLQWQNRAKYAMTNKRNISCGDQLQHSNYRDTFTQAISAEMKKKLGPFFKNAVARGEINQMPLEIYWSVAFAPLYSLVRWHKDGYSLDGRSFTLTPKIMREAFELVIRAFKK